MPRVSLEPRATKLKEEEEEEEVVVVAEVAQEAEGRGREEETSRRARGLAIFQWDLLEHHSKVLRPPGRASRLPSPQHFHLVPSHSTLSFELELDERKGREKGLSGRDARSLARSLARLVSSRLVSSRRKEKKGSSANYFILTPGPSDCACLSLDLLHSLLRRSTALGAPIV